MLNRVQHDNAPVFEIGSNLFAAVSILKRHTYRTVKLIFAYDKAVERLQIH